MKLVNALFGVAALRVSSDAVVPIKGAVIKDIIEGVSRRYELAIKPPLQLVAVGQSLLFQSGGFKRGEERIGILQLGLVVNGDVVMSHTTDQADAVLSDLINFLEEAFGYRYKSAEQKRFYHSNVVVQFEKDIEAFELFAKIETLLNQGRETPPQRFQFKRIGFGQGDSMAPGNLSIETIEVADFTIERRAGEPYSSNKFFCGAPMQIDEHLSLLEKIERLL